MVLSVVVISFLIITAIAFAPFYEFEGFGSDTHGGYSGNTDPVIYKVVNLNSAGLGSLKYGLENINNPRIIVFEISGTIELNNYIYIENPYVTVAGQTAPSPGITLKGAGIIIGTHDVIIQHLRIRVGDGANGPGYDWRDALDVEEYGATSYNVIVDHCSFSWATDEDCSIGWYPAHDVTFQWCIISECLYHSYHPDGRHSMGMLIGPSAQKISIHHNLFAHNADRNPLVGGIKETEIINNVVYNWEWDGTKFDQYTGYPYQLGNIIGNYYKRGLDTISDYGGITLEYAEPPSLFYVHENIDTVYRTSNTQDDWDLVEGGQTMRSNSPTFTPSGIITQNPFDAYDSVLENAGARPNDRDTVDKRIINCVKHGTGHFIDSQEEVGGWPILNTNYRYLNIPSNPHNDDDNDGFTNLEEWLQDYSIDLLNKPFINIIIERFH